MHRNETHSNGAEVQPLVSMQEVDIRHFSMVTFLETGIEPLNLRFADGCLVQIHAVSKSTSVFFSSSVGINIYLSIIYIVYMYIFI